MRLIDADELIKKAIPENKDAQFRCVALKDVINAPTVEQERKIGRWKKMTAERMLGVWWYECSECGTRPLRMRWTNMDLLSNFCPACGADMRGDKE